MNGQLENGSGKTVHNVKPMQLQTGTSQCKQPREGYSSVYVQPCYGYVTGGYGVRTSSHKRQAELGQ